MPSNARAGTIAFLNQEGAIIGAGILVGDGHVITCAHVVNAALGLPEDSAKKPKKTVRCFSAIDPKRPLTAKVIEWVPMRRHLANEPEDVAVLKVDGELPNSARPVAFVKPGDAQDQTLMAFGFPPGQHRGNRAKCELLGDLVGGWWQLDPVKAKGIYVQPGFSGTAVFMESTGQAVGMVVAANKDRDAGVGYMIPSTQLNEVWPVLPPPRLSLAPYLEILRRENEQIELKGLKKIDGRSMILPIDRFYITLHATGSLVRNSDAASSELELHEALQPRHVVIIGAPGSGKSTFLRRVAFLLSSALLEDEPDAARTKLGLSPCPFPVLVRIADLLRQIRVQDDAANVQLRNAATWLPHYLAVWSKSRDLETRFDKAFFSDQLKEGNVIVLFGWSG